MKKVSQILTFVTFLIIGMGNAHSASNSNGLYSFYVNGMATRLKEAKKEWVLITGAVRGYTDDRSNDYRTHLFYSPTVGKALDAAFISNFGDLMESCHRGQPMVNPMNRENCKIYKALIWMVKYLPLYNYNVQFVAYSRGNILVQKAIETALNETGGRFNESEISYFAIGSPIPVYLGRTYNMHQDLVLQNPTIKKYLGAITNMDAYYVEYIKNSYPQYQNLIGSKLMNGIFFRGPANEDDPSENGHSLRSAYFSPWGLGFELQKDIALDYISKK